MPVIRVETIGIQSPGDMGGGVGKALRARGLRVVSALAGRSERSRGLAAAADIEDVGDLDTLVREADLVLSILPPASALELAAELAAAALRTGARPVVADCNAIAPATVRSAGARLAEAGVSFIDAGIIGSPPGRTALPTRFYCSGPDTAALASLEGEGIRVRHLGRELGQASAMKMIYASVTKGTMTLHATALIAAEHLGLSGAYHAELEESQPAVWAAMNRMVPRLPLDAGRWIGEMHEITATFEDLGLPGGFHQGAAAIFELLERTPIAVETRETVDESRTLGEALAIYAAQLASHEKSR